MSLNEQKARAMETYKAAKAKYMESMSKEDWKTFCDAKTVCMKLGVRS